MVRGYFPKGVSVVAMDRQRSALICMEFLDISVNVSVLADTGLDIQTSEALISLRFCVGLHRAQAVESA